MYIEVFDGVYSIKVWVLVQLLLINGFFFVVLSYIVNVSEIVLIGIEVIIYIVDDNDVFLYDVMLYQIINGKQLFVSKIILIIL